MPSSTGRPEIDALPLRLRLAQWVAAAVPLVASQRAAAAIVPWAQARAGALRVARRALTGSEIVVQVNEEVGYNFALSGVYDWRLLTVAREACRPGDTIVEIGANVGTETIGFADIVGPQGRVVAFEPFPRNVERLSSALRWAAAAHVELRAVALADRAGDVEFEVPDAANSGVGRITLDAAGTGMERIRVPTARLDDELRGERARLVAIDVEGAEPLVLAGGAQWIAEFRPVIVLEAHHHRAKLQAVLTGHGYTIHSIERLGLRPINLDPAVEQYNWLAVHQDEAPLVRSVDQALLTAALLPPWRGVHPLSRTGSR